MHRTRPSSASNAHWFRSRARSWLKRSCRRFFSSRTPSGWRSRSFAWSCPPEPAAIAETAAALGNPAPTADRMLHEAESYLRTVAATVLFDGFRWSRPYVAARPLLLRAAHLEAAMRVV